MSALSARGIAAKRGRATALADFDLALGPGECVGLLGFNGAGKSTAISILAGLLEPDAGRVTRPRPGDFALVAEDPPTYPALWRVRDVFAYFERWRPASAPHVADAGVARILPEAFLAREAHGLSAGERRRVDLARAFRSRAAVLVLDEPTKALDLATRQAVWSLIRGRVEEGASVLLSSHDVEEVLACATRVVVLARGRTVHAGPVDALSRPALRVHVAVGVALVEHLRTWPGLEGIRVESASSLVLPRPRPGLEAVVRAALASAGATADLEPTSMARYNFARLMRGEPAVLDPCP